jgi:hypothetical protein
MVVPGGVMADVRNFALNREHLHDLWSFFCRMIWLSREEIEPLNTHVGCFS